MIPLQIAHSLQGSPSSLLRQLIALAKTFAILVLPVPLGPLKIYAWDCLPFEIALRSVLVTCV